MQIPITAITRLNPFPLMIPLSTVYPYCTLFVAGREKDSKPENNKIIFQKEMNFIIS